MSRRWILFYSSIICIDKILFQPLDLAPFGPLKAKMQTLSSAWHHDHRGEVLTKYTMMPEVAYPAFEEIFSNRDLIKTGFRIAGLFPWNPSAVHWEKLRAGSLYVERTPEEELAAEGGVVEVMPEGAEPVEDSAEAIEPVEIVHEVEEFMHEAGEAADIIDEVGEAADIIDEAAPALEHGMDEMEVEEVRPADGERFYWQDHQLTAVATRTEEPGVPPVNIPTSSDLINFIPEPGTSVEESVLPETNHEESVHLLQRYNDKFLLSSC